MRFPHIARHTSYLPAVVFMTGAAILIVEVVAVRLLSPFFGNTLYTFSSVLSVILAALAVGYYHGGRLADRQGTPELFFRIITIGGLSVLVAFLLAEFLLPITAGIFSLAIGPLVASTVLFGVPGYLLGMLSPFAVALAKATAPERGVGTAAGSMFFYSTLGSIAGSLSGGFFFIPFVGVSRTFIGVSGALVLLGLCGYLATATVSRRRRYTLAGVIIGAFALLLATFFVTPTFASIPGNVLYKSDGLYEQVMVIETTYRRSIARVLMLDRGFSSGVFVPSGELAFDYTYYYKFAKLLPESPKNALVIGGGTFTVPRAMHAEFPETQIDVVEIEPTLYELAQKYFGFTPTPKVTNITGDGRQFLRTATTTYDFIFGDAFSSLYSIPSHLTTKEFHELLHEHLSPKGMYVMNIIGSLSEREPSLVWSTVRTMQEVYPYVFVFAVDSPGSLEPQNVMMIGSNIPLPGSYPADPFVDRVLTYHPVSLARVALNQYDFLTDDRAPAEYYAARVLGATETNFQEFNAEEALARIHTQLAFGPRYPGSEGHAQVTEYIFQTLGAMGIQTFQEPFPVTWEDQSTSTLRNIVARVHPEASRRVVLGTHFDTKEFADLDRRHPREPVPGANDGASGVAVLLEIARLASLGVFPENLGIDLVFFDAEEGDSGVRSRGGGSVWQPLGSVRFAQTVPARYKDAPPEFGIVIDMVCDKNLDIYMESGSRSVLPKRTEDFFALGHTLFPRVFHLEERYTIADDHSALSRAGIPSMLIIDFDYPAFHTTNDTASRCSEESLHAVGTTLTTYLKSL